MFLAFICFPETDKKNKQINTSGPKPQVSVCKTKVWLKSEFPSQFVSTPQADFQCQIPKEGLIWRVAGVPSLYTWSVVDVLIPVITATQVKLQYNGETYQELSYLLKQTFEHPAS